MPKIERSRNNKLIKTDKILFFINMPLLVILQENYFETPLFYVMIIYVIARIFYRK